MISAKYEHGEVRVLLGGRAQLANSRALGEGVRDGAEKIRQRAVRNVSGYPVSNTGGAFVVRVKTGALKGAIESEWPFGTHLTARIFVNGTHTSTSSTGGYPSKPVPVSRYAGAIERGHKEIDLKKTMLGKTVPFFGARAMNAKGPYTETGLVSVGKSQFISRTPDARRKPLVYTRRRTASGGSYFIAFRKVGKKGWIIPAAKPRPFMAAAGAGSVRDVQLAIGRKVKPALTGR